MIDCKIEETIANNGYSKRPSALSNPVQPFECNYTTRFPPTNEVVVGSRREEKNVSVGDNTYLLFLVSRLPAYKTIMFRRSEGSRVDSLHSLYRQWSLDNRQQRTSSSW